jgi:M3 family oligoendopeptidase
MSIRENFTFGELEYIRPDFKQEQIRLDYHDIAVLFPDGNPKPAGDADYLLEAARKMYSDLSPETKEFFDQMLQHQMLDIKASPNKISNMGFCEIIQKLQLPFVFGNCNGTIHDVSVLTHEVGHAFQFYLAMREQPLNEYFIAVNDVSEIPSKTMELFAYPYAEEFCGKDADKFRFSHMQGIIEEICAYCSYNEFENYLYTNSEASLEEWIQAYNRIISEYEADIDFTGYETFLEQGLMLYRNMAVYIVPKYVISYALSEMGALQFSQKWHDNKEEAWNDYVNLCKAGGSMEYDGLMVCANLQPAYVEGSVEAATKQVKNEILNLLEKKGL